MAKHSLPDNFDDDEDELDEQRAGEFDDDFSAELDAELDAEWAAALGADWDQGDDEEIDDEDEPAGEEGLLREQFLGDGYRVVDLAELAALDAAKDDQPNLPPPTRSLEEMLYDLLNDEDELPAQELALLSALSRADQERVHSVWMQVPLKRRSATTLSVLALAEQWIDLDFGAFFRMALDDTDATVRQLAIEGMWDEGAPDLLGNFIHLLETDADPGVRAAAAQALGPFVLQGELDELDAARAMRAEQVLMTVLVNTREPSVVRCRALESIAYSGEVGVRQLIEEAYYAPDEELRLSALVAMGRSADVRWRRLARAELTNPSPAMRAQAAFACGELEARSALPDLLRLLLDKDETVRFAAMLALGHIGGRRARSALQIIATGPNPIDAFAASEALEEMDYYDSEVARLTPLFDETAAEDDEWDERSGWEEDAEEDDDDDLGEYA